MQLPNCRKILPLWYPFGLLCPSLLNSANTNTSQISAEGLNCNSQHATTFCSFGDNYCCVSLRLGSVVLENMFEDTTHHNHLKLTSAEYAVNIGKNRLRQ